MSVYKVVHLLCWPRPWL